jgi:hypothetical protein
MASLCMDSCKKFEHHDLQRLGKNKVAKEVQHALLTPSYGSKHHYNYILNHFQFKTWTNKNEKMTLIDQKFILLKLWIIIWMFRFSKPLVIELVNKKIET